MEWRSVKEDKEKDKETEQSNMMGTLPLSAAGEKADTRKQ